MTLDSSDRLDILDLYARYAKHFDAGEAEAWAGLFAPEGRFIADDSINVNGRDELAEFVRARHRPPGLRHFVSGVSIEQREQSVRGSAYVLVLRIARDGSLRVFTIGEYDDDFVKSSEGWRFQTRRFSSWLPAKLADAPVARVEDAPSQDPIGARGDG